MNKKKSKKGVRTLFAKKNEPGLFLKTASFLIAVVSLIVAVVSLIVASKNLRINEKSHENHPLVTQIGDVEIPYISNSYVYEIFFVESEKYDTLSSYVDLSKLHVPKFYNLHNKSVENLLYECAIDPLSSYAIIIDNKDSNHKFYSYDSLASKLVFNRSFEINKKSGIIKYQHDLLHAHDMLGNPILAIDIPDFQSMQLEMDFHLRYDGEIGIMHIPYIVSIYDIKSMKENFGDSIDYLRVRNSTMRLFYKDFYDKHNRDSVRTQADVLAFFIVDDTTIVVSNPEFFNIDEKDSESLYKRGNDYLISKNEKMKWIVFIVFTVLYWCLMIYVVIIAIILGRFYYKSKRFPKNLELKKIARIKWRTLYIVLAFFISYAPVYLYIVHKLY